MAILDARFARAAAAVPELTGALVANVSPPRQHGRPPARDRAVAVGRGPHPQHAASPAERWGVVTPEGVVLPEFLSHGTLALLLGARRPSVTSAMVRLAERGELRRRDDGRWLLHGGLETRSTTCARCARRPPVATATKRSAPPR